MTAIVKHRKRSPYTIQLLAAVSAAVIAGGGSAIHATDVTANWDGTTNNWSSASDWSTNPNYPNNGTPSGVDYNVVLGAGGAGPYILTLDSSAGSSGIVNVNSLTIDNANATLDQTSGTLDLTQQPGDTAGGAVNVQAGTYDLDGGTLADATLTVGTSGNFTDANGTLQNVTLGSDLTISGSGNTYIANTIANSVGLNFNGYTVNVTGSGYLYYQDANNSTTSQYVGDSINGNVNLIGNNSAIYGGRGGLTINSGATIIASSGGNNAINGYAGVTNGGTISATNGTNLYIDPSTFANSGTVEAAGASTLNFSGSWSNQGTIAAGAGDTVNFGSTFTAADVGLQSSGLGGTFTPNGATVNITGTLDNTGNTLTFSSATGVWNLAGTIENGTLIADNQVSGASYLNISNSTLQNVTLGSNLALSNTAYIANTVGNSVGLNFNGYTVNVTGSGYLYYQDANNSTTSQYVGDSINGNVNLIGNNSAIYGGRGGLTINSGATITASSGGNNAIKSYAGVTNGGTISATNGTNLNIDPSTFANTGTVEASGGGTVTVNPGTFTNYSSSGGGTLAGGIYVADNSTLSLESGSQSDNITTNAADVTVSGTNSVFTQINPLAINQGEFRVLAGRNFTAEAAFDNQFGALLQLGGGTFAITSGSFTNEGTVQGFGTVTPQVTNTGTIEATGGTLALGNGALDPGSNSTLESDPGATLDLSAGTTSSTTDYLINNGNLTLGGNNVTVNQDYQNANFGVGNSFNPVANVSSTGGKILAGGNVGMTVTGSVGGSGRAITLALGNIHVGSSTSQTFTINNTGSIGPVLRGAIQNAGLTDGRVGIAAQNFGPVPLDSSSGPYTVSFTGTGDGPLAGQSIKVVSNFANVAPATIGVTGTAWNLAAPIVSPLNTSLGDVHVGGTVTQKVTASNNAPNDGYSEQLDGQLGAGTGNLTSSGATFTGLDAGSTAANFGNVTLDISTAGVRTGSAVLALQSDGTAVGNSGLGITNLTGQTITMSATAYNYAVGAITSPTTVNIGDVHVGDAVTQNVTVRNGAAANGFSENLDGQLSVGTGNAVTNSGTFTGLAAAATLAPANTLTIGLGTGTAGNLSGTASLALQSDGAGIDTLGKTSLASQTININATAYNYAVGTITSPATINLGDVHVGDAVTQNVTVQNSAAAGGFSENLDGQLGAGTGNAVTNGGTFTGLAAGATLAPANTLTIGLNTSTAGNLSGSASLALQSDGAGIDTLGKTSLAPQAISINATAYNYAVGTITSPTTINIGDVRAGQTVVENITVKNSATADGFSENLDGQLSAGTGNAVTNGGTFTGLAAGATLAPANALTIGLTSSGGGSLRGSATLAMQSDGTGIDTFGTTNLAPQSITVNASAYNLAAATITSPTTISVGNVHVGDAVTQNITVQNSAAADGFSENLDGQLGAGTGNAVTNGGTFTGLAAGATLTPANTLTIGLNTGTAGNLSGSASLALQSDGAGIDTLGKTTLAAQAINITGTAYNLAAASVGPTTINLGIVHTGDIANQALVIGNIAPTGGFSEGLDAQFGTVTGAATTNGGTISLLAAGSSGNSSMIVGVNTSIAGAASGTVLVNLQSDGQGTSGLGKTTLNPITVNVSAQVNNFASALVLLGSHSAGATLTRNSATLYTLDLGTTTQGTSDLAAALGIENSATGPADTLAGNFVTSNASAFTLSGFSNFNDIAAGNLNANPNVMLSDLTAGNFSGFLTLDPFSQNASGYNGALNPITVDITGTVAQVPEPAALALLAVAGAGMLLLKRRRAM